MRANTASCSLFDVTEVGCRPSLASRHRTSRPNGLNPTTPIPRKVVAVAASMSGHAQPTERDADYSLGFGRGAEELEPPPLNSLAKGSSLGSASGGTSTSMGSSSLRSSGVEGVIPLEALSLPPVKVTGTSRIPGASASAGALKSWNHHL